MTPQDLGRELTLLRDQADLTVRQVARAAGLPASTAGDYFSGRHLPAAGQVRVLHKILSACGETDPDRVVWLWHVTADRHVQAAGSLTGPADWVNAVTFTPDGRTLAAGSSDDSVWVWDLATGSVRAHLPHTQPVTSLAWDGPARLAAADADGTVSVWSLPSPVLMAGAAVNSVAYSPDGRMLAVASQRLQLWDPVTRRPLVTSAVPGGTFVNSVAFSPLGTTLAAGYGDGMVQLWSRAGKPLGPPVRASASGLTESVAFSPDGRELGTLLAAASADNLTRLWSVGSPGRPQKLGPSLTGPVSYVYSVAFSPDGKTLAAGVTDGTVWLWNLTDPRHPSLTATLTGPNGHVYAVAFSPRAAWWPPAARTARSGCGTPARWRRPPRCARTTASC